ncbi:MAG: DUF222 domain-containing protein [Acidimicrobiales bacterium]
MSSKVLTQVRSGSPRAISRVSVDVFAADDLIAMQVVEVEAILRGVRRALARLGGYEAEVVDALEVLKRRARPAPPPPDPSPEPPPDKGQAAGPEPEPEAQPEPGPDPGAQPDPAVGPKPSSRRHEQIRKRASRIRDFPRAGQALKSGRINIEQFDELTRSGLGVDAIDALLPEVIASESADATRQLVLDAKRKADRTDPRVRLLRQQHLRRFAHGVDDDGNFWFNLVVDPLVGEAILRLFHKAERAQWHSTDKLKRQDGRTPANRAADAFAGLILNGSQNDKRHRKGDLPDHGAHLVIDVPNLMKLRLGDHHATAHTISGSPVPAVEWQKLVDARAEIFAWVLSCDGIEMNLARSSRHATEVQKFAMAIRDGGCVGHGCDRGAAACDGHHLIEWEHFGPTDIASMALQCPTHHAKTHKAGAKLTPGSEPGHWKLIQHHTGKTIDEWANTLPPWRSNQPFDANLN